MQRISSTNCRFVPFHKALENTFSYIFHQFVTDSRGPLGVCFRNQRRSGSRIQLHRTRFQESLPPKVIPDGSRISAGIVFTVVDPNRRSHVADYFGSLACISLAGNLGVFSR